MPLLFRFALMLLVVRPLGAWLGQRTWQSTRHRPLSILQARKRASSASSIPSSPYHLVIVESPSKCATIDKILNQYAVEQQLPHAYHVASCYGHVCNLAKTKVSTTSRFPYQIAGLDLSSGYQPHYVVEEGKQAILDELRQLAKQADQVWLATDPDREGEAMAWHLQRLLKLGNYGRLAFTEITPSAIISALQAPLEVNPHLVAAQETRRILDRLAGFTLSPVLWSKLALPGLSAGRVQSVGMALVVERERQRLLFQSVEYWDATAVVWAEGQAVEARLASINGTAIAGGGDFAPQGRCLSEASLHKLHLTQRSAKDLVKVLSSPDAVFTVVNVQSKTVSQQPPLPYRTSTLQMDANRQLSMTAQQCMRAAQQLYEAGLISYMRTDSTTLSADAAAVVDQVVAGEFGRDQVRREGSGTKSTKNRASKFAQEAHEAIRPAIQQGGLRRPRDIAGEVPEVAVDLYRLIYQRTLASRMVPMVSNCTSVVIEGVNGEMSASFRASGSVVLKAGYTVAFGSKSDSDQQQLPPLQVGQVLDLQSLEAMDHETQPPPRYNEASFVKELESLGVGRPSTYAGIIQILRDRAYVGNPVKDDRRRNSKVLTGSALAAQRAAGGEEFTGGGARGPMVPSLSAFAVTALMEKYCPTYVDPDFTARMEERLDWIASGESLGEEERVRYLDEFYAGDEGLAAKIKWIEDNVKAEEVRRVALPVLQSNTSNADDEIGLFVGPWGPYVQMVLSNSTDRPTSAPLPPGLAADLSAITPAALKALLSTKQEGGVLIGQHPDDGRNIRLKTGRFGAYLQWGDDGEEGTTAHSLPKEKAAMRDVDFSMDLPEGAQDDENFSLSALLGITLDEAIGYVGLPRTVSTLKDLPILAAIGPYGPYLKYNNSFVSLNKKDGDVLNVDAETAERLVTEGIIDGSAKRGTRGVVAELGRKDGGEIVVKKGRYGNYIKWKTVNAKLPPEFADKPEDLPLEVAWSAIQAKSTKASGKKKGGTESKKTAIELPPAPKRPKSAYLHFCSEKRASVSADADSLGEATKQLAALWAETDAEGRKPFEVLASQEQQQYKEKMDAWRKSCQQLMESSVSTAAQKAPSKQSTRKAVKDSKDLPKRQKSAYMFFCRDKRPEVATANRSLGETTKELARLWAETTDRSKYEDLAAADKLRYEEEKESVGSNQPVTYVSSLEPPVTKESTSASTSPRNGATLSKSTATAVTGSNQRAPSAYMLFCREVHPTIVDQFGNKLPLGDTTKRLAALWKDCDDDTRAKFQNMAEEVKRKLIASN